MPRYLKSLVVGALFVGMTACGPAQTVGSPTPVVASAFSQVPAPAGSILVGDSYTPQRSESLFTLCAYSSRIFATNDLAAFQHAMYEVAARPGWSADQSESAGKPLNGLTAVFREGQTGVVELGFWPSPGHGRDIRIVDFKGSEQFNGTISSADPDWSAWTYAAILKIYDGSYNKCYMSITPSLRSVSGRVTDRATGLPLPRIVVSVQGTSRDGGHSTIHSVATTDVDGRYKFTDYIYSSLRVGFSSFRGPPYTTSWWRDASSVETAMDVVLGGRLTETLNIDASLEGQPTVSPSPPVSSPPPAAPGEVNFARRYALADARSVRVFGCKNQPTSRPVALTECIGRPSSIADDDPALFASALDLNLAAQRPHALTNKYVVLRFNFVDRFVYLDFDESSGLLTASKDGDEIAVPAPASFIQLLKTDLPPGW